MPTIQKHNHRRAVRKRTAEGANHWSARIEMRQRSCWKTTNHSRASCFIRSRMTSRPHRLKKTSSMQPKRRDLHHTWLHRKTNEKLSSYCYSPRWITTTFSAWIFSSELSHTLRISLAIKNDKSIYAAQVKHILNSPRDVRNYTWLTFDGNWPGKTRWLFYYLVAHKSPAHDCGGVERDMFDTQDTLQGGRLQYTGNCFCERIVHPVCICTELLKNTFCSCFLKHRNVDMLLL